MNQSVVSYNEVINGVIVTQIEIISFFAFANPIQCDPRIPWDPMGSHFMHNFLVQSLQKHRRNTDSERRTGIKNQKNEPAELILSHAESQRKSQNELELLTEKGVDALLIRMDKFHTLHIFSS